MDDEFFDSPQRAKRTEPKGQATAACLCGAVALEIDTPAFWAWHDHTAATRHAHGAAYATYAGVWKSRLRIVKGEKHLTRFEDKAAKTVRRFCAKCGTPMLYERGHSPKMVNIPRALFAGRTGREPRYHVGIEELQEWAYLGERLKPLKGYPGVVWNGGRKSKPR